MVQQEPLLQQLLYQAAGPGNRERVNGGLAPARIDVDNAGVEQCIASAEAQRAAAQLEFFQQQRVADPLSRRCGGSWKGSVGRYGTDPSGVLCSDTGDIAFRSTSPWIEGASHDIRASNHPMHRPGGAVCEHSAPPLEIASTTSIQEMSRMQQHLSRVVESQQRVRFELARQRLQHNLVLLRRGERQHEHLLEHKRLAEDIDAETRRLREIRNCDSLAPIHIQRGPHSSALFPAEGTPVFRTPRASIENGPGQSGPVHHCNVPHETNRDPSSTKKLPVSSTQSFPALSASIDRDLSRRTPPLRPPPPPPPPPPLPPMSLPTIPIRPIPQMPRTAPNYSHSLPAMQPAVAESFASFDSEEASETEAARPKAAAPPPTPSPYETETPQPHRDDREEGSTPPWWAYFRRREEAEPQEQKIRAPNPEKDEFTRPEVLVNETNLLLDIPGDDRDITSGWTGVLPMDPFEKHCLGKLPDEKVFALRQDAEEDES